MGDKEVCVLWLSREECIACGATDMERIGNDVEKGNLWMANLGARVYSEKNGSRKE